MRKRKKESKQKQPNPVVVETTVNEMIGSIKKHKVPIIEKNSYNLKSVSYSIYK